MRLENNVNGEGAKNSLNYSNSNNYDQINWPVIFRTQNKCMWNYRPFSVSIGTDLFDTTLYFLLNKY